MEDLCAESSCVHELPSHTDNDSAWSLKQNVYSDPSKRTGYPLALKRVNKGATLLSEYAISFSTDKVFLPMVTLL